MKTISFTGAGALIREVLEIFMVFEGGENTGRGGKSDAGSRIIADCCRATVCIGRAGNGAQAEEAVCSRGRSSNVSGQGVVKPY